MRTIQIETKEILVIIAALDFYVMRGEPAPDNVTTAINTADYLRNLDHAE